MAGKGGGAWKVAYADFVTAMMAFFLVMWITAQNTKVKEAIAEHFQQPLFAKKPVGRKPHSHQVPALLVPSKKSTDDPAKRKPPAVPNRKSNPAPTGALVFFPELSAELDQDAKDNLLRLVPWIAGKPQKIEIRGHASRRPLPADGPYRDAWQLSYARCLATMHFLAEQGISRERIRLSQAAGFEPKSARGDGQASHNSRVEVTMLNELSQEYLQPLEGGSQGDSKPLDGVTDGRSLSLQPDAEPSPASH